MNKTTAAKTIAERASVEPTELHKHFAEWLTAQTGIEVDLKTVQLAVIFRMDFQASPENQAVLAAKKAAAVAAKKSSAARKKAKLEAELAKLTGKTVATTEEPTDTPDGGHEEYKASMEEAAKVSEPVKLTVIYGGNEPEVHKFGCADAKKKTAKMGFSKETAEVSSHTELTHLIYSDMIDSGESSLEDNYMAYDAKPCCGPLDN